MRHLLLLVLVASVLCAPVWADATNQSYFLSEETPFASGYSSAYIIENTTLPQAGNWSYATSFELSDYNWSTSVQKQQLTVASITGFGTIANVSDAACRGNVCRRSSATGTDGDITLRTQQFDLSGTDEAILSVRIRSNTLTGFDFFHIRAFDGTFYDTLLTHNLSTPGNDFITYNLSLASEYRIANAQIELESESLDAGEYYDISFVEVKVNGSMDVDFPTFVRNVNQNLTYVAWNLTLFHQSDTDIYGNFTVESLGMNNTVVPVFLPANASIMETNTPLSANKTVHQSDKFYLDLATSLDSGQRSILFWRNASTPSRIDASLIDTGIAFYNFTYTGNASPVLFTVNITSNVSLASVLFYHNGALVGSMAQTVNGLWGIYYNAPLGIISGNFTVVAENVLGTIASHTSVFADMISTPILVVPNFQGDFYMCLDEAFTFSLEVYELDGTIPSDANLTVTFLPFGETYNLTFNPSTDLYEVTFLFNDTEILGYTIDETSDTYELYQDMSGNISVQSCFETCIEIQKPNGHLIYNRGGLESFDRDGIVFAQPIDGYVAYPNFLRSLNYFAGVENPSINPNVFTAPYVSGSACLTLYNGIQNYSFYYVDGTVEQKDNYDPLNVIDYGSIFLHVDTFKPFPNRTYTFSVDRWELYYKQIFMNAGRLIFVILLLAFVVWAAIVGGPAGVVLGLIAGLLLWALLEVLAYVFI